MIQIEVNNSTCRITGLEVEDFRALKQVLSYSIGAQASYFSGAFGSRRYLIDRKGCFPSGLLPRVKDYLNKERQPFVVRDLRRVPSPKEGLYTLNLGYAPHEWQERAVEALMASNGTGLIVAPTGSGKATVVAMAIAALNVKAMVVVPTLALKQQLTQSLKASLGASFVNVKVENVDALDPKKPLSGYDAVIIDEYHASAAKKYQKLNLKAWKDVYHKVGLTATPYRSLDEEQLLFESIVSGIVYRLPHQEAVDKGYIAPLQAFYIELPPTEMKGNPTNWHAVSSELIVNNVTRNTAVVDMVEGLEASGKSTLVLVKEVRHGLILQDMLEKRGLNIAFASGENDNNRELLLEFNLRERNTLIATGVLGVGVDTKPCEYVLLAAGGKSRPQLIQNIGRCLRSYPEKEIGTAIIFLDNGNTFLVKHFKAVKKAIAEEYGCEVVKL